MHEHHRERLRQKALKYGCEALEKHEVLELILGYSIPRRNTNDIAHKLIDRFGNLYGVFNADIEELCEIEHVGEYTATMIKLLNYVALEVGKNELPERTRFRRLSEVIDYARLLFMGAKRESVYALLLDSGFYMIDCVCISVGSVKMAEIDPSDIIKLADRRGISNVILLHNHPSGDVSPSKSDFDFTNGVEQVLSTFNIRLIEHIAVGMDKCHPIMKALMQGKSVSIEYDI